MTIVQKIDWELFSSRFGLHDCTIFYYETADVFVIVQINVVFLQYFVYCEYIKYQAFCFLYVLFCIEKFRVFFVYSEILVIQSFGHV